jgi:hypothetical protein
MAGMDFRDAYEFEPDTYSPTAGLLGRLQEIVQQRQVRPTASSSIPDRLSEYDSSTYGNPQGGLLGRLLKLQAEQGLYQPNLANTGSMQSAPLSSSFAQRETATTQQGQYRPVPAAVDTSTPDSVDIAKSAGIGLANGLINTLGFLADASNGFGLLPKHLAENRFRGALGLPDLPADTDGWVERLGADGLRHSIEGITGAFYQPKSTAGRYAETIGEMVPMLLGGEAAGVAAVARSGGRVAGRLAADNTLRELPATLAKHAIAPGIAAQALKEAYPESTSGEILQKVYPVARRAIPPALEMGRHLRGQLVQQ